MLFNSYIFIFIFLPITLLVWFQLNKRNADKLAGIFLIGMSLWFYAYFNFSYLFIIIGSIALNYVISFLMQYARTKLHKGIGLIAGLISNLGLLFYFKYFDFFIININHIFKADFNLKHILLPLGISFFTFQQLSFIIDRCTGKAKHYSIINYAMFVTFFPQLIAGPIVLHDEIIPQFEDKSKRRFQRENFEKGIVFFVIGLGKKVLLADILALVANFGFEQTYFLDSPSTIFVLLAYAFELYFDFSGYCDMAMGIGKMFNFDLPSNFNSPYLAYSIKELWNRWHITLSRFLTTYIYFPLGGSRKGRARLVLNILIVFTVSGFWHGADWTYVVWGITQGIFVAFDNLGFIGIKGIDGKKEARFYIPKWLGQICTFSLFTLSLIFFRSNNMTDAFQMFKNIFAFKETGYFMKIVERLNIPEIYLVKQLFQFVNPEVIPYIYVILFLLLLFISVFIITRKNSVEIVNTKPLTSGFCWALTIVFVWSVISFSQVSTFIYFNF